MHEVKLYSRPLCSWCLEAKEYLHQHHIAFTDIDVGRDAAANAEMQRLSGQTCVPTIVIDGQILANFAVAQLEPFLQRLGFPKAK